MAQPGRQYNPNESKFGFQGYLKDNEIAGQGNSYSTYWRQYDPRLGRWWKTDPVKTAWESPYASFSNNPIFFVDPLGAQSEENDKVEKGDVLKDEEGNVIRDEEGNPLRASTDEVVVKPEEQRIDKEVEQINQLRGHGFITEKDLTETTIKKTTKAMFAPARLAPLPELIQGAQGKDINIIPTQGTPSESVSETELLGKSFEVAFKKFKKGKIGRGELASKINKVNKELGRQANRIKTHLVVAKNREQVRNAVMNIVKTPGSGNANAYALTDSDKAEKASVVIFTRETGEGTQIVGAATLSPDDK